EHLSLIALKLPQMFSLSISLGEEFSKKLFSSTIARIQQSLNSTDILAKTCDDTFSVLVTRSDTSSVQSLVRSILDTFKSVLKFDRNQVLLAPSVGIVDGISHYSEISHIIRDSHIAAQHALNTEGASSHVFSPSSYRHVVEQLDLETRLCEALEHDEFLNHYQPIYDLASRQLVAFESLVRWQPPGTELAYPNLFIPHMETTGSIVSLGTKVLDLACAQMQQWAQLGYQHFSISINLSARQIAHDSLLDDIQACLDKYEIIPEQLKFEVTESVLMEHIYLASNVIDRLHNLGMTVSIDDFGTGYSSLSYLQKLPFDGLKIDRSFIQNINKDGENTEILDAVINLAHSLNMTVTAEGIENLEQLNILKELGCDYGQGYRLGMPSEAKDCSLAGDWHLSL
ncbi:MAG: GGDEF domain-containing phosphodiesterase, partial [Cyanobacteria bacterium P01_E01_bin.6]